MEGYDPYQAQNLFPADQWETVVGATEHSDTTLELNFGVDGMVGLRDGSNPDGPVWAFDDAEWSAFGEAVQVGQTRQQ